MSRTILGQQIVAFRGATAFEFQINRAWLKIARPRYWGLRHIGHHVTCGLEPVEATTGRDAP